MATEADLVAALRRADAAGDRAGATRIAQIIQAQRAPTAAGQKADPVTGYLTTAARAVPGLTELGAGYSAALRTAADAMAGRPLDFGARFNEARGEQQGVVDQFGQDHPIASANATGLGTVAPAAALGGASLARAGAARIAATAAKPAAGGVLPTVGRVVTTAGRNAMAGGAVAAAYGAGQPGTLDQRAANAVAAIPGGAFMGAAAPAALGGVVAGGRAVGNAFGQVAPRVGAVGSELADAASRAVTGKTPGDQARPLTDAQQAQGRQAAVDYLRRTGVTPEQLEAVKENAGGKPITTAEAIGPDAVSSVRSLSQRSGNTRASLDALSSAVASGRSRRIIAALEDGTGLRRATIFGNIERAALHTNRQSSALWDIVDRLIPPFSQELQDIIESTSMTNARTEAQEWAEKSGYPEDIYTSAEPADDYAPPLPTSRIINFMSQILDKHFYDGWDPKSGDYNLDTIERSTFENLHRLKFVLASDTGDFGEAYRRAADATVDRLTAAATYNSSKDRLFDETENGLAFAAWFSKLRPVEQLSARAGAAHGIYQYLTGDNPSTAVMTLPNVQQKLTALFGDRAESLTSNLIDEMDDTWPSDIRYGSSNLGNRIVSAYSLPFDLTSRNALGELLLQRPKDTAKTLGDYEEYPNALNIPSTPGPYNWLLGPWAGGIAGKNLPPGVLDPNAWNILRSPAQKNLQGDDPSNQTDSAD